MSNQRICYSLDNKMNLPPFTVRNDPILVRIDVLEEFFELRIRYRYPGFGEGGLQFTLINFSIVVPINRLKELPQPVLGMVDKRAEFW